MHENFSPYQSQAENFGGLNAYISKVFGKMFLGLAVTAIAAAAPFLNGALYRLVFTPAFLICVLLAELAIVFTLSSRILKIKYSTANLMFYVYAAVNGLTLSSIFAVYNVGTVYAAFAATALAFGTMSVYGTITKKDLTKTGNIFLTALIGVIAASVINIFVGSGKFDLLISFAAVALFSGLTAFDSQKLKSYYFSTSGDAQLRRKVGIMGALSLYLDFINIFLYILKIFGNKRD